MKSNERPAFARYLTDVLAYYRQDTTEFVLNVWWAGCEAFELADVKRALGAHVADPDAGQFPPKVADVVRALRGTGTDRAQLAWNVVHRAMAEVGAYQHVDFRNPAIHAAIADLGGWPKLCRMPVDELRHEMHRFCEAYRVYSAPGRAFEAPSLLRGDVASDDDYRKRGLPPPQPVLIEGAAAPERQERIARAEPALLTEE